MNEKKFKLLYLSSDKHPVRRVDVSVLFAEKLAGRGHKIDFVFQSEADCPKTYESEWHGCRVLVGRTDNRPKWYSRIIKHLLSIAVDIHAIALIRKSNYDFVQLKDKYLSALFLIPVCKLYKVKFLYWSSYPFPEESLLKADDPNANYPFFYRLRGKVFDILFYRFIVPYAEFVFVQSEQMKLDLIDRGVPTEKQLPVPMGVSMSKFPDSMEGINTGVEIPIVLHLGTLARVRKMDFLIRVFSLVSQRVPEARFQLVGGGDDELDIRLLQKEADRLGILDKILFTGWLPMAEALELVKKASVCVSPFYPTPVLNSTSPTKLVEYMAMGKAVVANAHPEQRLVIDESQAGICVQYDEHAFSDAIVELLKDSGRCTEMGKRGREYVEKNRTYERIAEMVERQYLALCDQSTGMKR
jgi:glycosyltransferase involved in cell wall biosynthesis